MEKLEKAATAEEKKLAHAEKLLEEDALVFDSFLQEVNKNSAEAVKMYSTEKFGVKLVPEAVLQTCQFLPVDSIMQSSASPVALK